MPAIGSGAQRAAGIDTEVAGACVEWLSETSAVLALRSGQLLTLQLAVESGLVRGMRLVRGQI